VYPYLISRPERGSRVPLGFKYNRLVHELNEANLRVIHLAADAPKRSQMRQILSFNGRKGMLVVVCELICMLINI
jgi:hypothetical protein